MPRRISSLIIVLLLISSALAVLASSGWTPQGNTESPGVYKAHILTGTDNTWMSDGASYSGISTSWQNGSLTTGQNVWFTNAHVGSCTWNNSLGVTAFGSFNMKTGYTGTITQAGSFGSGDVSMTTGTFAFSNSYTWTCSGNFNYQTAGNHYAGKLILSGATKTFYSADSLYNLTITGSYTWAQTGIMYAKFIDVTGTYTIPTSCTQWSALHTTVGGFWNTGTINGAGTLYFYFFGYSYSIALGAVNCPVSLFRDASGNGATATLASNANLGSTLLITSSSGAGGYSMTLDLSSSNYALSATDITIGTRGILDARGSRVTCSGNWDSSAGTFTQGTSSVRLTGASKTLKTTGTSTFNKLFLDVGASYTLSSNVITQQYWKNGTLALNGHTLYVDVDQAPAFVNYDVSKWVDWFSAYSYTFTATDREGETLTFSLTSALSGLTIGPSSGIATKPAPITNSTYTVTVSVSDGNHTTTGTAYALDIRYTPTLTNRWTNTTVNNHYWTNTTITNRYWTNNTVTYRYWSNVTGWTNTTMWIGSAPDLKAIVNQTYSYQPIASYLGNSSLVWNMTTNATGLSVNDSTGQIIGKIKTIGTYWVNLTATAGMLTVWQNFTLTVGPDSTMINASLVLALVFGFGLILLAFIDRKRAIWPVFGGFVWLTLSVVTFYTFGVQWMIIGIGIGLILMLEGSMAYAAGRKQGAD